MESVSILSLNDDCLCNIISYLNDISSFYSFSLTCKRFNHLAENERNWHINVLKRKPEFYIRQFIAFCGERAVRSIGSLLFEILTMLSFDFVSYNFVLDKWKSCGPVAAKIFSWIKSSTSNLIYEKRDDREYNELVFYLPICGQELSISYFVVCEGNYEPEINSKISCGDLQIESKLSPKITPAVDQTKPIIELLQKELGDTVPPLTNKLLFVWMYSHFQGCNPWREQDHKIYFKNEAKNAQPTPESLKPVLERYRQNKAKKIKKHIQQLLKKNDKFHYGKKISGALEILAVYSKTVIEQLRDNYVLFFAVISDKDLRKAPKKMMLGLVNRTTLRRRFSATGNYDDKQRINKIQFRMKGGSAMEINGDMQYYLLSNNPWNPIWFQLTINFSLPDGRNVEIPTPNCQSVDEKEDFITKFSPITEILQECIDEAMKDDKNTPRIRNIFTFYYFLEVMQFSEFKHYFENCKQDLFESSESVVLSV